MKNYFITSDIHSYFSIFKEELNRQGFDINNQDHILIVCGDLFDRGDESLELYDFILSIPKERRILIRGNHEYLLRDLANKAFPDDHDISNGTVKTLFKLAGINDSIYKQYTKVFNSIWDYDNDVFAYFNLAIKDETVKNIINWINSNEWVDYFELDEYIFVHSFIPLKNNSDIPMYALHNSDRLSYFNDWRTSATKLELEESTWGCPWQFYKVGLFDEEAKNGKILVCGHWHTSDFYKLIDGYADKEIFELCPTYYGKNIIALDACTVYTNRCNILVIEK